MRANRSSTLMPLTTLGLAVSVLVSMTHLLCVGSLYRIVPSGLVQRGERGLNALTLLLRDQSRKHLAEVWVLGAGMDVLPPVGFQERGLDRSRLRLAYRPAARSREVAGVGFGLRLQDAVHRRDQLDELVHRPVALL